MSNIIEFAAAQPDGKCGDMHCWLCQRPVALRALFCHHCGTIQPVRDIDHFSRLGIDRRIDLDNDFLDKQYKTLRRALDPDRFALRGMGERGHGAKQLEALELAYETLREPLRRGKYWLSLHNKDGGESETASALVKDLSLELEQASEAGQCDRVAQKAGQAMEQGIKGLMQALRAENWNQAQNLLADLDGLEEILGNVRDRRDQLAIPSDDNNDITRLR